MNYLLILLLFTYFKDIVCNTCSNSNCNYDNSLGLATNKNILMFNNYIENKLENKQDELEQNIKKTIQ